MTNEINDDELTKLLENDNDEFDVELLGVDFSTWVANERGLYEIALEVEDESYEEPIIVELSENEVLASLRTAQAKNMSFEEFVVEAINHQMQIEFEELKNSRPFTLSEEEAAK